MLKTKHSFELLSHTNSQSGPLLEQAFGVLRWEGKYTKHKKVIKKLLKGFAILTFIFVENVWTID
jgi:hypothetical protein